MPKNKIKKENISEHLERLSEIADWFEQQKEVDIEEGLEKVKEASVLINKSRKRLEEIENEFEEIKKDVIGEVDEEDEDEDEDNEDNEDKDETQGGADISGIPF
jgi:hypothetical protein